MSDILSPSKSLKTKFWILYIDEETFVSVNIECSVYFKLKSSIFSSQTISLVLFGKSADCFVKRISISPS